jgi:hypothetical protein
MIIQKTIRDSQSIINTNFFCGLVLFFCQIQSVLIYLVVSFILTLEESHFRLFFLKKRLKFNHIVATDSNIIYFHINHFLVIMMFVPLILSQGQNLSLLNTAEIEKTLLQLINQITVF